MGIAPNLAKPFESATDAAAEPTEPPSATGQYPGPVWADEASAAPAGLSLEDGGAPAEPPSATGQYPGPVWADERSNGDSAPMTLTAETTAAPSVPPLGLKEDETAGDVGSTTPPAAPPTELTNEEAYRIIRVVATAHSGDQLYSAISPDLEYTTPGNSAFGRRHFGLGFGLVLFGQASGLLGHVLELTQSRNPILFGETFGPNADELVAVTNAATEDARLAPVGGDLLWAPVWLDRFRLAGALAECQAAQNETAIEAQFRPMARIAAGLGLDTDRALAMAYDVVVARGLTAGLRWIAAVGPIASDAQRDAALASLGHPDLAAFQAAAALPATNGRLDPATHAALVVAVRRRDVTSWLTASDLECRLLQAARGPAATRLERLRSYEAFDDIAHTVAPAPAAGG
jgi:hypothetical protein